MSTPNELAELLQQRFADEILKCVVARNEVTIEIAADNLHLICRLLRDEPAFAFEQLIDLCGVDYLLYGQAEWQTTDATTTGFSRGVEPEIPGVDYLAYGKVDWTPEDFFNESYGTRVPTEKLVAKENRFAVVYHLLSVKHNHRLRVRIYATGEPPMVDSIVDVWPVANWFEREAFDLYGILFAGHPDLRRLLTDYGFIGHPFRKDFPLSGHVEVIYDEKQQRVIYQPVSIPPRILVPRVIRNDSNIDQRAEGQIAGTNNG